MAGDSVIMAGVADFGSANNFVSVVRCIIARLSTSQRQITPLHGCSAGRLMAISAAAPLTKQLSTPLVTQRPSIHTALSQPSLTAEASGQRALHGPRSLCDAGVRRAAAAPALR